MSGGVTKESLEYRILSQKDVTEVFSQKGLKLVPIKEGLAERIVLGGIEPEAYKIANTSDCIFVYEFASYADRYDFCARPDTMRLEKLFASYSQFSMSFTAKNLLIIYSPHGDAFKPDNTTVQRFQTIKNLVFADLNKGHILVFRGEGRFWEAQTTYRYIQQFYKDAQGVLQVDSWETQNSVARYKGQDVSEVGPIDYSITRPHGSGKGTGATLDSKGIVRLGGSGGNGALNNAKDIYTFTIEWKDQKETFELKMHPYLFALFPYE